MEELRYDKYLWAVRLYKTRSIAIDACKAGKITINGQAIKPARAVKLGEEFEMKATPIKRTFRVKALLENRVGAKLVTDYLEDLTPPEELEKALIAQKFVFVKRDYGTGRPTKRERRDMDKIFDI